MKYDKLNTRNAKTLRHRLLIINHSKAESLYGENEEMERNLKVYEWSPESDHKRRRSFARQVIERLSGRIGGAGYVLVDDDSSFSSPSSNESRAEMEPILNAIRSADISSRNQNERR